MCGTAGWDLTVARAVCKQLGYVTVMWEWSNSEFGRSDLQSSVCDVRCPIMSESLEDCTIDWDKNGHDCQCNDKYHVGITCYYPGFLGRYKSIIIDTVVTYSAPSYRLYSVTIQGCIQACRDEGKTIAVLEIGSECYCGDNSVHYKIDGEAIPILIRYDFRWHETKQCSGDVGISPFIQGCGGILEIDVYNKYSGACGGDYTDSSGYIYHQISPVTIPTNNRVIGQ
ncbi:kremen protein 1-like [Ptychodera flava]|uniref:kremen protein 1-like n=1 Tax=Ptychodera flava TaxID=63121 RepID=UPI00396A7C28